MQLPMVIPAARKGIGLAAPSQSQQTLIAVNGGQDSTAPAPSGSLLQVILPSTATAISYSASATGVQQQIPNSCPQCQFVLDGNGGTLTVFWTDGGVASTYTVSIVGAGGKSAPPAPHPHGGAPPNPKQAPFPPVHVQPFPVHFPIVPPVAGSTGGAAASSSSSMSTTTIALAVAAGVAVVAGGGYLYYRSHHRTPVSGSRPVSRRR